MLGKYVRVRVTVPMGAFDSESGNVYRLNYGIVENGLDPKAPVKGAYIMGVTHAVRNFEGRVIAVIKLTDKQGVFLVVAPKSKRFIVNDIRQEIEFMYKKDSYSIDCLYEKSCGAIVFRIINGEKRFLLIKNKRSNHWGFPKGHVEDGETEEDTAKREVLEESGIRIRIFPGFKNKSEYTIRGRIEKSVSIFLATTDDVQTVIQPEEIEDYIWLNYDVAMKTLNYVNDKGILQLAKKYIDDNGI